MAQLSRVGFDSGIPQMFSTVVLIVLTCAIVILVHFEAMSLMSKVADRVHWPVRIGLLVGVFTMLVAHSIEVWIFAGAIYLAIEVLHLGMVEGPFDGTARDYLYFSLVNYTTLGYGEIVPTGHLRTLSGFEALTGLLMMAWSAAFTVFRLTDRWRSGLS
jgi:hypothetical protein